MPRTKREKGPRRADNILAHGETTGHFHQAVGGGLATYDRDAETILVVAPNGLVVEHQEHGPVTRPAGRYVKRGVREFDHLENEARAVVD